VGTYDTRGGTPQSPTELHLEPTALQEAVLGLLEDAGIGEATNDQIMKLIEEAELNLAEKAYERHQEYLMETGGGPTLQEQQIAAMKLK
jgi:hypothetical protein